MGKKGDGNFRKARGEAKKVELDQQLQEYINEWRKQRAKEEEELKKLKDKQAKRKEIRAEQEKKLAQQKKEEEERLRKEENEKKAQEAEEKRQEMMKAQKEKMGPSGSGNKKKGDSGMGNVADIRREMTKTKEQLEEEKKISLSIRIRPLELDGMDSEALKEKGKELWEQIIKLETEKYDLEEKVKRQDYDLKELKERQRQQNKQKAIKLGLDP